MNYYVTTGSTKRVMFASSPEEAAIIFLRVEDGPFGILIEVCVSKSCVNGACFFYTETLLKELKRGMCSASI